MKSSLSLFISSTVILISVDCDSSPVFRDVFMACSLSLTGVRVRLAFQLWLTSACCRVVVIQLWLALLLLASRTNTCSHEPSYSDHNNSSYSSTFSMSDNKPDKSTDGNDVSKMTHSSWVSWFGFIWSDNELKLHRVIRRHTTSCSVLKAQWLSFLQSWLGRFWLQLDSPNRTGSDSMQHTGSTIIYEAYFHHGIKHLKRSLWSYLTIRTNFLTSATFITHSEEFWVHISQIKSLFCIKSQSCEV